MRRFKVVRVAQLLSGGSHIHNGKRYAINTVQGDCGHTITVHYWPIYPHYRIGDKVRCYQCGLESAQRPKSGTPSTPSSARDSEDESSTRPAPEHDG